MNVESLLQLARLTFTCDSVSIPYANNTDAISTASPHTGSSSSVAVLTHIVSHGTKHKLTARVGGRIDDASSKPVS